jgi:GTP-binding protein Era
MVNNKEQKCSFVALIGAPNAGKSTLTNYLVGQKVSIVSPKVQTTRNSIKGIMVEGDTQMIFIDTPGLFLPKKERPLERSIVKSAWSAIREANVCCLLIDATKGFVINIEKILEDLTKHEIKPVIVINKVDLVAKEPLLQIMDKLIKIGLDKIFLISALSGDGIAELKKYLLSIAKPGEWKFDPDDISDAPLKFMAAEITREKIFLKLRQDLPYSTCVKTDSWEVLNNGDVKIHQTIFVLKESQKMIVVGKKGEMLKEIGQEARADISQLVGAKIHLFLFVKIQENWMSDSQNYGYNL